MDLKGKNVVISGGMHGIGLATCKQLINAKISSLAILDIIEIADAMIELKTMDSSVKVIFIETDVSNRKNVEDAFEYINQQFKSIDIVICNAGKSDEKNMEQTMNLNFFGVVYMTTAAIKFMSKSKSSKGGTILAVSSTTGLSSTYYPFPVTSASKQAVIGYYRALSNEFYYNKHNIKFLLICPGLTKTSLLDHAGVNIFDGETTNVFNNMLKSNPMQTAASVGKMMIDVLKTGENGSAWIADDGKLTKIEFKDYWP